MLKAQDVFNIVVTHLFAQGKAARDSAGQCRYRTREGLSCAVGCLIPDEVYRPEMEGAPVKKIVREFYGFLPKDIAYHENLLRALQLVHDYNGYGFENDKNVLSKLAHVAVTYRVNTKAFPQLENAEPKWSA